MGQVTIEVYLGNGYSAYGHYDLDDGACYYDGIGKCKDECE